LGEADRLLAMLSPTKGKLRAIAKGVRRPGSRKAGHLEPFTRVLLLVARGRELDIITQAEAIDTYPGLREDLVRLGQAGYVAELLDRFGVEGEEAPQLYRLLVGTLERLATGAFPVAAVVRHFELRLLDQTGYRPELHRCVGCSREVQPEDQYFSSQAGGVLCPACGRRQGEARPLALPALKVLRHYQRSAFARAAAAPVSPQVHADLDGLMEEYLTSILERRLNAPAFLREVQQHLPGDSKARPSA
jgi:DNA repair protein RecO (recombination protein O)